MSKSGNGTGYTDPVAVKTAICSKCEALKTWNHWWHHDPSLCDDCYYTKGKYYNLSKEEAVQKEREKQSFDGPKGDSHAR